MPFTRDITLRFSQLDPAGILFFGEVFTICSGIYEDFIQFQGFEWGEWFQNATIASPVRHVNAEYLLPLEGGHVYAVSVEIAALGTSSFEVEYVFQRQGFTHCRVRIVHVFIERETRTKIPIPDPVRAAFTRCGVRSASKLPSSALSPEANGVSGQDDENAVSAQRAKPVD